MDVAIVDVALSGFWHKVGAALLWMAQMAAAIYGMVK